MGTLAKKIEENLARVRTRVAQAAERAGRDPAGVQIVAVTKSVGIEEVRILVDLGIKNLGENRVENAGDKIRALGTNVCWHMVGNIQRRKVRDVVASFDRVDSVDRVSVAQSLEQRCAEAGKTMPILIEVNLSGEAAKHGFAHHEVATALETIEPMTHLQVKGLMTMAPNAQDPEATRPIFARARELAQSFGLPQLSMGMSNDFEIAVEEGATEIRIGTTLFK